MHEVEPLPRGLLLGPLHILMDEEHVLGLGDVGRLLRSQVLRLHLHRGGHLEELLSLLHLLDGRLMDHLGVGLGVLVRLLRRLLSSGLSWSLHMGLDAKHGGVDLLGSILAQAIVSDVTRLFYCYDRTFRLLYLIHRFV